VLIFWFPHVDIPVKRKIEKKREKVLYHESVLKRNPFVQPVPSSVVGKKAKKKVLHKTHGERVVLTGMSVT
jgi:nucleolar protein 53